MVSKVADETRVYGTDSPYRQRHYLKLYRPQLCCYRDMLCSYIKYLPHARAPLMEFDGDVCTEVLHPDRPDPR